MLFWPWMFGGAKVEQAQIVRLEALVMWTESLRDTIYAGPVWTGDPGDSRDGACPDPPSVDEAHRLGPVTRTLDRALLSLSADLKDASADKVIGSLILNVRQRGTGLAAVLTSLASAGRAELDQRRRIMAGRASMRRSVRIVVIITIAFALFLVIFSRTYVAPYASVGGQVALAIVLGLFALSFMWMRKLAGGEPGKPFLGIQDAAAMADAELRVVAHLTGLSADDAQELTSNRPQSTGWRR